MVLFQSTLPSQGATRCDCQQLFEISYFNPRSPHRERRVRAKWRRNFQHFNPRSPHRERHVPAGYVKTFRAISIHAPLTGSDELGERPCPRYMEFQSTLPSQGATITELGYMDSLQNFNPRSPHRERRRLVARLNFRRFISIHAPLTGSDAGRQIYLTV